VSARKRRGDIEAMIRGASEKLSTHSRHASRSEVRARA
jgi:hypothetical protein